jgi:hypothetical protein
MLKTLRTKHGRDRDLPQRAADVLFRQSVLAGSIYDVLKHPFYAERSDSGEYIPLRERRPSVRYNLCNLVVDESVELLFSDAHFPTIQHEDGTAASALVQVLNDAQVPARMIDAAKKGAVGSVALWLRVLEGRVYVDVLTTEYLTPVWNPKRPDQLLYVRERYKVRGEDLAAMGYTVKPSELRSSFYWTRDWTDTEETWYVPQLVQDDKDRAAKALPPLLTRDDTRSVVHSLGVVPIVWIKNLPGGDSTDGKPTFSDEAVENQISLEYLLSQAGRGLTYASDPLLLMKEPALDQSGQLVRSASNAIIVGADGDAKLLEIDGGSVDAVLSWVREVREYTLEMLHGNRAHSDKMALAQSGRALELLNQSLIWLTDNLRESYGRALLQLCRMILRAAGKSAIVDEDGQAIEGLTPGKLTLQWPPYYAPTDADKSTQASTLRTLTDAGLMSTETAVKQVAATYSIDDVDAELLRIATDQADKQARLQPQVTETITA